MLCSSEKVNLEQHYRMIGNGTRLLYNGNPNNTTSNQITLQLHEAYERSVHQPPVHGTYDATANTYKPDQDFEGTEARQQNECL